MIVKTREKLDDVPHWGENLSGPAIATFL